MTLCSQNKKIFLTRTQNNSCSKIMVTFSAFFFLLFIKGTKTDFYQHVCVVSLNLLIWSICVHTMNESIYFSRHTNIHKWYYVYDERQWNRQSNIGLCWNGSPSFRSVRVYLPMFCFEQFEQFEQYKKQQNQQMKNKK